MSFFSFWGDLSAQFETPAVQKRRGVTAYCFCRNAPSGFFENKNRLGAWSGLWRLVAKIMEIMKIAFGSCFRGEFWRRNLVARMFGMHVSCRCGKVISSLQVILYRLGFFAIMLASTYMFFLVLVFFEEKQPCSWKSPPSRHSGDHGASFSRGNIPLEICYKMSIGGTVGPMAVGCVKLLQKQYVEFDGSFGLAFRRRNLAPPAPPMGL